MKKILLLNPPGEKLYIRDYYCSKVSQADYIVPPIDFLFLSGRLAERYSVEILDAIVLKLKPEQCLKAILDKNPDVIIFLTGSVSWKYDIEFISEVKKQKKVVMIGTGDIFLEKGKERLENHSFIDAVLLDFSTDDIMRYLEGDYQNVRNMLFRENGQIVATEIVRSRGAEYEIPIPKHDLFIKHNYRHPFSRKKKFTTILTDFGCPYKCVFCIMCQLGFKYRKVNNVMDELNFISSLGIKEVFFADQSFGAIRGRNQQICELIIKDKIDIEWFCFSRVDLVDEDFLRLMEKAGCHTIIFGVETANEGMLEKYRKGYKKEQIKDVFRLCREQGIKTAATFILGLPEETKETLHQTLQFALEINCDYASFNFAVPRMGTELRSLALKEGLIESNFECFDQSGSEIAMPSHYLSKEQILSLKKMAIKKFYFRPSYIWRRIRTNYSFFQLKNELSEGWALFKKNFIK